MTGRDLILFILQNNLENEEVIKDGVFLWLMSAEEAAVKFGVGTATIHAWYACDMLDGIQIAGRLFFLKNIKDPRQKDDGND